MGSLGGQDPSSQMGSGEDVPGPCSLPVVLCALGSCLSPWFQGYEGLVEGGENIKQANWLSVSNIIQLVRPARGGPVVAKGVCCVHTHTRAHRQKRTQTLSRRGRAPG